MEATVSIVDVLPIALLGGVLGLDVVSFPQAMISRPLVAATLAGALDRDSRRADCCIGAALELIALETLPFGASRYPEWGSAAVVGGAIFASHPSHPPGAMTIAVLGALATTWVGGWTMVKLRQLNAVLGRARARRTRSRRARHGDLAPAHGADRGSRARRAAHRDRVR